jgi:hypothetical protein
MHGATFTNVSEKLFYSWQHDSAAKTNKDLIRRALDAAVKLVTSGSPSDLDIVETERGDLHVDQDTQDLPGNPEIASSILRKIEKSSMFVGDLTLVGEISQHGKPKKKTPNPNVLLELGYAARHIGWDRMILVMNTHYGDRDEQIFDIKHRRFPIGYEAKPGSDTASTERELAEKLADAIRARRKSDHEHVDDLLASLGPAGIDVILRFGGGPTFTIGKPKTMGNVVAGLPEAFAMERLVQLGMVRYRPSAIGDASAGQPGSFEWTHFGRLMIERFRKS